MKSHREISINSSCVCWFSCNDFSLTQRNECFLELIVVFPFPSFDSIQCRVAKWCGRVLQSSVRNKTRHDFISSNTGGTSFVTIFQWIRVKLCWRPNSSLSIRSIESSEMCVCVRRFASDERSVGRTIRGMLLFCHYIDDDDEEWNTQTKLTTVCCAFSLAYKGHKFDIGKSVNAVNWTESHLYLCHAERIRSIVCWFSEPNRQQNNLSQSTNDTCSYQQLQVN